MNHNENQPSGTKFGGVPPLPFRGDRKVPGSLDYKPVKVPFILYGNIGVWGKFEKVMQHERKHTQ